MKKTSRTFKRFAAITSASLLAACMVAPMAMTSNAADTTTITITDATPNSEYAAYQLMSVVQDGTKFAYTVNPDYKNILAEIAEIDTEGKTDLEINKAIIDYIDALDADSTTAETKTRAFADAVYAKVKSMTAEETISGTTPLTVDQGYYLIVETKVGETDPDDSFSLVMLDTAGDEALTIDTKEDEPTLVKKVKDINDSEDADISDNDWQDSADHNLDDVIPFQLTGTVSEKIDNYKEYYYSFHDTLSKGLTFNEDSIKVTIGTTDVTEYFDVINVVEGENGTSFEVMCSDLKLVPGVNKDSSIVVEYNATLNSDAIMGSTGNPNVAKLEYSTNPYFVGGGTDGKDENEDTGFTPDDKVIVFTYKVDINKIDPEGDPLDGATFQLEKKKSDGTWEVLQLIEATSGTNFYIERIDDGDYRLTELIAPEGYNLLTKPIEFTVSATHTEGAAPALTELKGGDLVSGDFKDTGVITADIENKSGTELPSTGGIGTTVFYLGGGAMVAVAGIYLISKKRMKNTQE